jgi:hypothetical protein
MVAASRIGKTEDMTVNERTLLAGLAAGAAGTAAMTLSSTIEMKMTGRQASTTPADALEKVSGEDIPDEEKPRTANAMHLATGMALGLARGAWGTLVSLPEPVRSASFFPIAWSPELVATPALGLSDPPWKMPPKELAVSAVHHLAYTVAAGAADAAVRRAT